MSTPNHNPSSPHEHGAPPAQGISPDPREPDDDFGEIISSIKTVQISTPPSLDLSATPSTEFSLGEAAPLRATFSLRELPESPDFADNPCYASPPLIGSSSINTQAGPLPPAFHMMDLPSSGEFSCMNPTELYPDSSTSSPAETQPTLLRPINLSADDSDDGFADSSGRREEVHPLQAYFEQIIEPHDDDNEGHDDGPTCADCRRVGNEFRSFLMAINERGAAQAFNDQEIEEIEQNVAEIYEFEAKAGFEPDLQIAVPPAISMFNLDFNIFLPMPPDRSEEFLALGADPEQVKTWAKDYFDDVEGTRADWEAKYASGVRNFELELAPQGESLKKLARDTFRNFIEFQFNAEVTGWVDEDLEKCRRGEWFLSYSAAPGTSEDD